MALTDLTRISTSGIATGSTIDSAILRKDVNFRGSQVGVNSAIFDSSERQLNLKDNVKLTFGDDGDLKLYHSGSHSYIDETGMGNLYIRNGTKNSIWCKTGGQVNLYFNDEKKFETTNHGAVVTGILTATSFSGPVVGNTSNASGISTFYDLRVSNNLTVEGTTTTLDTNLIGVDRVEIDANSNTIAGIAVTQSGTADLVRLYDGSTQVVTVDDTGNVGLGSAIPTQKLDVAGSLNVSNVVNIGEASPTASENGQLNVFTTTSGGKAQFVHSAGFGGVRLAGTAGASGASLVFSNNYNSGTFSDHWTIQHHGADDSLRLLSGGTGGTQRLHIKSNGLVGIGTANPGELLVVYKTTNDAIIKTRTTAAGAYFEADSGSSGYHGLKLTSVGTQKWFLGSYNSANFQIKDGTSASGAERFTIEDSTGNIGINETVPLGKLHVKSSDSGATVGASADELVLESSANTGMTILSGTTSEGAINFGDSGDNNIGKIVYTHNGNYMYFKTNNTERVRITSDGKVGIGTNNPQNKFEVYGTDAAVTLLNYGQSSGGLAAWTSGRLAFVSAHQNDNLVFGYSNTTLSVDNFVERMRIDNGTGEVKIADGGFLTIDTDASGAYGISEAIRIDDSGGVADRALQIFEYHHNGARYHRIQFNTNTTSDGSAYTYTQGNYGGSSSIEFDNSGHLSFFTDAEVSTNSQDNITPSERLTIKSDGKIGIGINNPDELLHIFSETDSSKIVLEADNNSANNGIYWVDEGDHTQTEFLYSHPDNKQSLKVNGNGFEIYSKQQSNVIAKIGHGLAYNDVVVPNGKLGVGTDNAGTTLDVFGNLQVKTKASALQNFFISDSSFKFSQSPPNWTNMDYTSSPVLAWDYKSGPGDLFYIGSGGNTPIADQMALVVSDAHGVKIGRSGYDNNDFDVDSNNEFFRITTSGNVGINESNPTSKLVVDGQVVVNNSNLIVDKHHIDGTDDWAGASHQLHHKRTFTNNTWTNYFKLYRTTITANNNNVGVYGAMLHIVYINDRSNSVQTTGYDVYPFIVRARSSSTLSGNFGSALVNMEEVIGSSIEVRFDSATANQINIQIKVNNVDDGGSEQLVHAWIDGGGVASSSSLFLYPSILT